MIGAKKKHLTKSEFRDMVFILMAIFAIYK